MCVNRSPIRYGFYTFIIYLYFSDEEIRSLVVLACTVNKAYLLFVRPNILFFIFQCHHLMQRIILLPMFLGRNYFRTTEEER